MSRFRDDRWRRTAGLLFRACVVIPVGLAGESGQAMGVQVTQGGPVTILAQLQTGNAVALVDPATGVTRRIYQSNSWSTTGLTVSPTGAYLGLLEVQRGVIDGVSYRVPPSAELILLDTTGAVVRRVATNVVNYTWCGAACLVYIRGTYDEGDLGFSPTGVFVVRLPTNKVDSLPGPPYPHHLKWAPFDSSVYFKYPGEVVGRVIVRYRLSASSLEPTSHRDLDFSPDGKYYLGRSDGQVRLYDTATDREIPTQGVGLLERWLPTNGSHLLVHKAVSRPPPRPGALPKVTPSPAGGPEDADYVIYAVGARRVVNSLRGHLAPWASAHGVVPFVSGGHVNVLTHP